MQKFWAAVAVGAFGTTRGAASAVPLKEIQPFTVCVTVSVALEVEVVLAVVALLLQSMVALSAGVNESVDRPQTLATDTTGVSGVDFGAATPEPAAEVHPFTV